MFLSVPAQSLAAQLAHLQIGISVAGNTPNPLEFLTKQQLMFSRMDQLSKAGIVTVIA
jgi:hypothetical protein